MNNLGAYLKAHRDDIEAVNHFLKINHLGVLPMDLTPDQKSVGESGNLKYSKASLIKDVFGIFNRIQSADEKFVDINNDVAESEEELLRRRGHSESYLLHSIDKIDLRGIAEAIKAQIDAGAKKVSITLYLASTKEMCNACTFIVPAIIERLRARLSEIISAGSDPDLSNVEWVLKLQFTGLVNRVYNCYGNIGDPESLATIARTLGETEATPGYVNSEKRAEFVSDTYLDYRKFRKDPASHNKRIIKELLQERQDASHTEFKKRLSRMPLSSHARQALLKDIDPETNHLVGQQIRKGEERIKAKILDGTLLTGDKEPSCLKQAKQIGQSVKEKPIAQKPTQENGAVSAKHQPMLSATNAAKTGEENVDPADFWNQLNITSINNNKPVSKSFGKAVGKTFSRNRQL